MQMTVLVPSIRHRGDKMLNCSPWALLPPIYSVCIAAGLWVVYFVAVNDGKIVPLGSHDRNIKGSLYPPYISVAGNFPPASCIFSEVMNLAAFVGFTIAVLRYIQLRHTIDSRLNAVSLVVFSIGCFGMTLVGNVQLFTEEVTHNFGTLLTFGLGTVFCWMQSYITLRVNLRNEGRMVALIRFLLSGSITVCVIVRSLLMSQDLDMHAARCQWALVMLFLIFLSTFAIEFRHNYFNIVCTDVSGRPVSLSDAHSQASRYQLDQM
ncbi:transmembrane protein 150C isoform X1 [Lates calcarifer]|uniref:Transmembrane protein 150C isoform X1 n=2 Tax=Lates calcarifer TaxID=8187 RepID=A0AAJ7Q8R9_LATCA|nr:transmembrane protein 150C isoform X1 [Lates calcarifer]